MKGKGLTYFLGCVTIAITSVFTIGCGEPKVNNITIDGDEIQFSINLSDDYITASQLTNQIKKQIFDELNAKAVLSDGSTTNIEWNADEVLVTIDSSERKVWGRDTGVFKFKIVYQNYSANFYVEVNAVPVDITVNHQQSFDWNVVQSRGGNKEALESLLNVTLLQRTGYDSDGNEILQQVPLTNSTQRSNLSFEWTETTTVGVDGMPTDGVISANKTYECQVTYSYPGTNLQFVAEEKILATVNVSSSSSFVSTGSDYAKIIDSQISQKENVITLTGNIAYESAKTNWNGIEINKSNGNIAGIKILAPNGIKTSACSNPCLVIEKSLDNGVNWIEPSTTIYEFLNSAENERAYFYHFFDFESVNTRYRVSIQWSEFDAVQQYIIKLDSNIVLESPQTISSNANWVESQNGVYNIKFGTKPDFPDLANNIDVKDVTEAGDITLSALNDFTLSYTWTFNQFVPGLYQVVMQRKVLTGTNELDKLYLNIRVLEPEYVNSLNADDYSLNQTVLVNQETSYQEIIVGGQFDYYRNPDFGLSQGYILGAKLIAVDELLTNSTGSVKTYLSNDQGKTWELKNEYFDGEFFDSLENETAFFNFYCNVKDENTWAKVEVKWNDSVATQTYIIKIDANAQFYYGNVELNTESKYYTKYITATHNGSFVDVSGNLSLSENDNGELVNIIPLTFFAPNTVLFNENATITVYKMPESSKFYFDKNYEDTSYLADIKIGENIDAEGYLAWQEISSTSLIGCVEGSAFTNLDLVIDAPSYFRVAIDWFGDKTNVVEYNIITNDVEIEFEEATSFEAKLLIDGQQQTVLSVPFGTSENFISNILTSNIVATFNTATRQNVETSNFEVVIAEGSTYDSFAIGSTTEYVVKYLGETANGQELVSTLSVVVEDANMSTIIKGENSNWYDISLDSVNENEANYVITGIVQQQNNKYSFNFDIFSPLYSLYPNTQVSESFNPDNDSFKIVIKTYNSESSSWENVSIIENEDAKNKLQYKNYPAESISIETTYFVNFNIEVDKQTFNQNFAIEIVWANNIVQMFTFDTSQVTLEQMPENEDLLNAVLNNTLYTDDLIFEENTSTVDNLTDYIISGLCYSDENDKHEISLDIKAPKSCVKTDETFEVNVLFNDEVNENYVLPTEISFYTSELEENYGFCSFIFSDEFLNETKNIKIIIKWGKQWLPVTYYFNTQNLVLASYVNTTVEQITSENQDILKNEIVVNDAQNRNVMELSVNSLIQVATFGKSYSQFLIDDSNNDILAFNEGDNVVKFTLKSDVAHNNNVRIGVLKSLDNGATYVSDNYNPDLDIDTYRIWYGGEGLLSSTAGNNAEITFTLKFDNADVLYNFVIYWNDITMPLTVVVSNSENNKFANQFVSVLNNNSGTNGNVNDVRPAENNYELTEYQTECSIDCEVTTQLNYLNNYVIWGELNFEDASSIEKGNNFIAGAIISKPSNITDFSQAGCKVYVKRNGETVYKMIEKYEQVTDSFLNKNGAFVFLPQITSIYDEFIIIINWGGSEIYDEQYFHFSIDGDTKLNFNPKITVEKAQEIENSNQNIVYDQSDYNISVSGDINLYNGIYYVSGKFNLPVLENSLLSFENVLDGENYTNNDIVVNLYTREGNDGEFTLISKNANITFTENGIEFAAPITSRNTQIKVDIQWGNNFNTESYIFTINENARFMVESEVSLITEDDQYAYSENQTISKGSINIESKEQSCYMISGVIAYVGANEALNMVASGYRVGVTFNIPDGISADGSGYIKSALASDENASFSAMTEVAKIEENQNSVTIYVTFNGFKNICKLELQWNALQTPETIYLKLEDNIDAEIRADATVSALQYGSSGSYSITNNITVSDGVTVTFSNIATFGEGAGLTLKTNTSLLLNEGASVTFNSGSSLSDSGCNFQGNTVTLKAGAVIKNNTNYTEETILEQDITYPSE